jgi:hypothetical protein
MEVPDVPLDQTQDHIKEHARQSEEKWVLGVAVSTAIFAAIAAIASLLAGQHINEGLMDQIRASDKWAYYQAKGIKAGVLDAKMELLAAQGKAPAAADSAKAAKYIGEQDALSKEALMLQAESGAHLARHERLASAVTLFQIGIAVSAIAVLTRRRWFWFVGLAFGCGGLVFFAVAHG